MPSRLKSTFFDIFLSGGFSKGTWSEEIFLQKTLILVYEVIVHCAATQTRFWFLPKWTFFRVLAHCAHTRSLLQAMHQEPCSLTHLYSSQKVIVGTTQQSSTTLRLLMMMEPVFMTNIKMTPRAPKWRRFDSEILKGN